MAIGLGVGSLSGWLDAFAADTVDHPQRVKSVILLWMNGGPATIDLWDLKPGHANGGPSREIETATPGIRISENLPKLARRTNDMVLIRSMTSKEGDHGRATHFVKTGYTPQGAIRFPTLGSLLTHELGEPLDLPGFVSIAPERVVQTLGGGFLGPKFAPLAIGEARNLPVSEALRVPDLQLPQGGDAGSQIERLGLLEGFEKRFDLGKGSLVAESMRSATTRAVRLMQPDAAGAFRIEDEPDVIRDAYGRNLFGQGCLLARRLVERGVACMEVTLDGWDTHQNNFEQVKGLAGTLDNAFATLLGDLKSRGLLDSTLVVCQGEFGRTPKINAGTGRDHWPRSWASVLAGGGIQGGQVIGKTTEDGTDVVDRPIRVPDLIATVCKAVGLDPTKQNISNVSRPIRLADPSAKPVEEIL